MRSIALIYCSLALILSISSLRAAPVAAPISSQPALLSAGAPSVTPVAFDTSGIPGVLGGHVGVAHSRASRASFTPLERAALASAASTGKATLVGAMESTVSLPVEVVLPLKNTAGLQALIKNVYDPASPLYGHYLNPNQFTEQFGPDQADVDAVAAYLSARGLTVTLASRTEGLVRAVGPVSAVQGAFGVHIAEFASPAGRLYHANDTTPVLPGALSGKSLAILGLDTSQEVKTASHRVSGGTDANAGLNVYGSGPGNGLSPADVISIYSTAPVGTTVTGTGQTIGIFEADTYLSSDISTYASEFGFTIPPVNNIGVDGFAANDMVGANEPETALDIELMLSLASGANQYQVYECSPVEDGFTQFVDTFKAMATIDVTNGLPRPNVISVSYYWTELALVDDPAGGAAENAALMQLAVQGQSVFVCTGDSAAWADQSGYPTEAPNVADPSSEPYATAVGGTDLSDTQFAPHTFIKESSWFAAASVDPGRGQFGTGSGGGVSTVWPIPGWQVGAFNPAVNTQGSTTARNVPDVSLYGDYDTGGYSIFFTDTTLGANWFVYNGTSASTPLWAAYTACVNQQRVTNGLQPLGFANPAIYSIADSSHYAADFHDVKDGTNNGVYSAFAGYDNSTGWGSFNGGSLFNDLVTYPGNKVPTPTISPNGASISSPIPVGITDSLGGTSIYYTIDGSIPTVNSTPYTVPLTVSSNEIINAIAVSPGYANSAIASATFLTVGSFAISPQATLHGTLSPNTKQFIAAGDSVGITATPSVGYQLSGWTVDGTAATGTFNLLDGSTVTVSGSTLTFSNVQGSHNVDATFSQITFTLTPLATTNGQLAPNSVQTIGYGGSQSFTATPSFGYGVGGWTVDGNSVSGTATLGDGTGVGVSGATLTFSNLLGSHTVGVTFTTLGPYTLTPLATVNGAISPNVAQVVVFNGTQTFSATPAFAYKFGAWKVDGLTKTGTSTLGDGTTVTVSGATVTFSGLLGSHTIGATFTALGPYALTPKSTQHGTLTPNTVQSVAYAGIQEFTSAPAFGYALGNWSVDATPVTVSTTLSDGTIVTPAGLNLTFSNVLGPHSVAVGFTALGPYTIAPQTAVGGTVFPSATQTVAFNASKEFTVTPAAGYSFGSWLVDNNPVTGVSTLSDNTVVAVAGSNITLSSVQGNHTVGVTFNPFIYTLTPQATVNGGLTPNVGQNVLYNATQVVTASPSADYSMGLWMVDGSPVGQSTTLADGTVVDPFGVVLTFSNIHGSHTYGATFYPFTYLLTPQVTTGGGLAPNSIETVSFDGGQAFTASPSAGYVLSSWMVDGSAAAGATVLDDGTVVTVSGATLAFGNVQGTHTVSANFSLVGLFSITPLTPQNGTISPSSAQVVGNGGNATFSATPDATFNFTGWTLDSNPISSTSTLTDGTTVTLTGTTIVFSNIDGSHSVGAIFTGVNQFSLTPIAAANGMLAPNTVQAADPGSKQVFTAAPALGFAVAGWMVDSTPIAGTTTLGDGTLVSVSATTLSFTNVQGNHTVEATFVTIPLFVLTPIGSANGAVSPSNAQSVPPQGSTTFTALPTAGFALTGWIVDSKQVIGTVVLSDGTVATVSGSTLTFTNVKGSHTVSAIFGSQAFTLTPQAVLNGSLTPSTAQPVAQGGSLLFTAATAPGYVLGGWTVDGASVSGSTTLADGTVATVSGSTLQFKNVQGSRAVGATFTALGPYVLTPLSPMNGSIAPSAAQTVSFAGTQQFTISANAGFTLTTWTVDGAPITGAQSLTDGTLVTISGNSLVFSNVHGSHTVGGVLSTLGPYVLTPLPATNGELSPGVVQSVSFGGDQPFMAEPALGFTIDQWFVDGFPASAAPYTLADGTGVSADGLTLTFSNVQGSHIVAATFVTVGPYDIVTQPSANGTLSPSDIQVAFGGSTTVGATPANGYTLAGWTVDGVSLGTSSTLSDGTVVTVTGQSVTLTDIQGNHTVGATFAPLVFTVTVGASANGTLSPSAAQSATYGSNLVITATPDANFLLGRWSVDGKPVSGTTLLSDGTLVTLNGLSLTLDGIHGSHAVAASFTIFVYFLDPQPTSSGLLSPGVAQTVPVGGSQSFTAAPTTSYGLKSWTIDGNAVTGSGTLADGTTYTIEGPTITIDNVQGTHAVGAVFGALSFTLTPVADANGTLKPSTAISIAYHGATGFIAKTAANYTFGGWLVF